MPIDPSTAFVSYSREDLEFASRLAKDLKAKGAKVWMDKLDLRPGQLWDTEVEAAVDACSRMLVILSPAAVASQKVKNEFMAAMDEGKEVIPVFFRECKIPLQLRRLQYADFRSDYSVGLEELLASLSPGQREVSGPEAIALAAITEALGLDPAPSVSPIAAAEERERQQEGIRQQEQAEADRLASLAEEERKQREQGKAVQLAADEERNQQQAEAQRLALIAEADRRARERAEAARAAAEAERKQPKQAQAKQSDPSRKIAILVGLLLLITAGLALKDSRGLLWIVVGLIVGWATAMLKGGGGGIPVLGIFGGIIGAVISAAIGHALQLVVGVASPYNFIVPIIGAIIGALILTSVVGRMLDRKEL